MLFGVLGRVDLSHQRLGLLLLLVSIGQLVALAVVLLDATTSGGSARSRRRRARTSAPSWPSPWSSVILGGLTAPDDGNDAPMQLRIGL